MLNVANPGQSMKGERMIEIGVGDFVQTKNIRGLVVGSIGGWHGRLVILDMENEDWGPSQIGRNVKVKPWQPSEAEHVNFLEWASLIFNGINAVGPEPVTVGTMISKFHEDVEEPDQS